MSTTTVVVPGPGGSEDPHGHSVGGHDASHAHSPHLAHHFDTPAQQFSTSKLGMWTFLATEVLMFGGLFCAYAVYRSNHPEVYLFAHNALNPFWGMVNTIVLLASSFTMAWGVRAAQMNNKGLLQIMLALTFLGGVVFMCVKGVEYKEKWEYFLFPGHFNAFNSAFDESRGQSAVAAKEEAIEHIEKHAKEHAGISDQTEMHDNAPNAEPEGKVAAVASQPSTEPIQGDAHEQTSRQLERNPDVKPSVTGDVEMQRLAHDGNAGTADAAVIAPPDLTRAGTNLAADQHEGHHYKAYSDLKPSDRQVLGAFFAIYFMMTGLHGIHVLVGMGLMVWLFVKASSGAFSEKYFTPVDLGGLYWHLVDLIWIFLFPLLYLIH